MTNQERLDYLVKMGMEAYDRAFKEDSHMSSVDPDIIKKHMRERMAQVAEVWKGEVEEMAEADRYRCEDCRQDCCQCGKL